jgi:hypothetical protein
LDACLVAFRHLSPSVNWRPARRQPKGSYRAPGIFEKLLQYDAPLNDRELFPTPYYFGESNFLAVGTTCTVKQHQRCCKRQSPADQSHKTREGFLEITDDEM